MKEKKEAKKKTDITSPISLIANEKNLKVFPLEEMCFSVAANISLICSRRWGEQIKVNKNKTFF